MRHPLVEAGLTQGRHPRRQPRARARHLGQAGEPVPLVALPLRHADHAERLARVAAAEDALLRALGFRELRVRFHDQVARIEVPVAEMPRLLEPARPRATSCASSSALGFLYVTLDLQGFRSGSLNETLRTPKTRRAGG